MAIKEPFEARARIAQDRANLSKAGTEIIKRRRMTLKLIASTGLRFKTKEAVRVSTVWRPERPSAQLRRIAMFR
jgi:hypothetical protein